MYLPQMLVVACDFDSAPAFLKALDEKTILILCLEGLFRWFSVFSAATTVLLVHFVMSSRELFCISSLHLHLT